MSLPETEKEKSLASNEAEDVLQVPQDEKQSEGSFKDYLVRETLIYQVVFKNTAD